MCIRDSISRLCYDVSVRLSIHLSVCDRSALAHYRLANLGFKFQSQFTVIAVAVAVHAGAREGIIAGKSGGIISRYASHC